MTVKKNKIKKKNRHFPTNQDPDFEMMFLRSVQRVREIYSLQVKVRSENPQGEINKKSIWNSNPAPADNVLMSCGDWSGLPHNGDVMKRAKPLTGQSGMNRQKRGAED